MYSYLYKLVCKLVKSETTSDHVYAIIMNETRRLSVKNWNVE